MRFRPAMEPERPTVQLAPMLDIFCLLLIFFMVTAAYSRFETELDVKVPVAKEGADPDRKLGETIINVKRDGTLVQEGVRISESEFRNRMAEIAKHNSAMAVILRGDQETPYKNIVRVLDLCREVGIWNVAFATDRPENAQK